jgi:hypothetical protein
MDKLLKMHADDASKEYKTSANEFREEQKSFASL